MKKFSKVYSTYDDWKKQANASSYKRIIERLHALHPNVTLSQLRGHPGKRQRHLSDLVSKPSYRIPYQNLTASEREIRSRSYEVLSVMRRKGYSLSRASREIDITPEAVLNNTGSLRKDGNRWIVKQYDTLQRSMVIYSDGRSYSIIVNDSRHASLIGRYHNAVKMYRNTGDESYLKSFKGARVRDIHGNWHTLETDPKKLYDIQERTAHEEFFTIYNTEV